MRSTITEALRRELNATSGTAPLLLLEISHPDLPAPIRVVRDTLDVTHDGEVFTAMAFDARIPDDLEGQNPRAELVMDNVGREVSAWIEASGGGQGATVRMIVIRRDDPDVIEWEVTLDLSNTFMNQSVIRGSLGFDNLLAQPGVTITYRPEVAPGLF